MVELGISHIPSMNHLRPVLRNLRRDQKVTLTSGWTSGWPLPGETPNERIKGLQDLPKIMARLLYAAVVRQFFVYCGPWADWLHLQSLDNVLDVKMLHEGKIIPDWGPGRGVSSRAQWPAFVIRENRRVDYGGQTEARFSRYGDILEHAESRDLVLRLANR